MTKIIIATGNETKDERIRGVVKDLGFEIVSLKDFKEKLEVVEDGKSFKENAIKKAIEYSKVFGDHAVTSDGGIHIPKLANWEALLTKRQVGDNKTTDEEKIVALLDLLKDIEGEDRTFVFREALAIADKGEVIGTWFAETKKYRIAKDHDPKKILPGFWFASIWIVDDNDTRYSELDEQGRAEMADHWTDLKRQVEEFFKEKK